MLDELNHIPKASSGAAAAYPQCKCCFELGGIPTKKNRSRINRQIINQRLPAGTDKIVTLPAVGGAGTEERK